MNSFSSLHLVFLLTITLLFSNCTSDSKTEERLKKLEEENRELKRKISNNSIPDNSSTNYSERPSYDIPSAKYVFVLLDVSQREMSEDYRGKITKTYNYCSEIQRLSIVTEDIKYQLMDKIQSSYLNSGSAMVYEGQVNKRQIFVYDTYEAASKERAKYLVND